MPLRFHRGSEKQNKILLETYLVKFRYSEKLAKFCKISTLDLTVSTKRVFGPDGASECDVGLYMEDCSSKLKRLYFFDLPWEKLWWRKTFVSLRQKAENQFTRIKTLLKNQVSCQTETSMPNTKFSVYSFRGNYSILKVENVEIFI